MIGEALLTGGAKGFSGALAKLTVDYAKRSLGNEGKADQIKTDITSHIDSTFKRCSLIKTLLDPLEPANFLEIHSTQRFKCSERKYDHFGLVECIRLNLNNIIVTGSGGSGKSMFMRYLWLSLFSHSEGRIPIFIELRTLNNSTTFNMESYLYYTLSEGSSSISQKDFSKGLKNSDFIVILDGFDEVASEKQEEVQRAIMSLATNYPTLKIILSGRPDDRFTSWNTFKVITVEPMTKEDAIELIGNAAFDKNIKTRFIKKIQSENLFSKHKSFLSNPLLASMMLLTYSRNFDIPNRMHLFYDQAFEALYSRHDSYKPGGFVRQFKSGLAADEFKRLISYFCLISYYEQDFEFSKDEIISTISKSISIENLKVSPEDFLYDLINCVCLIIPDGLVYTFPHRSFQEYFSAYCLAYVTSKNFERTVDKFLARPNDQVIPLLEAMNPELFRESYTIPKSLEYEQEFQIKRRSKSPYIFMRDTAGRFLIHLQGDEVFIISYSSMPSSQDDKRKSQFHELTMALEKVIRRDIASEKPGKANGDKDKDVARAIRGLIPHRDVRNIEISGGDDGFIFRYIRNGEKKYKDIADVREMSNLFKNSYMFEWIDGRIKNISKYVSDCRKISRHSDNAMKDIFS